VIFPYHADPGFVALVSAAVRVDPGFVVLVSAAVRVDLGIVVLVSAAVRVDPGIVVLVSAADPAESGFVVFVSAAVRVDLGIVVPVSAADFAESQAPVDIAGDTAVAFDALVPLSVVAGGVDSPERPRFFAFPNIDYYASSPSPVEVVGAESDHSPTGVRTNYGLGSIFSNLGLHHNKSSEHHYNNPNPGHNIVSDTNDLPMDATTSHSRKTCLHLYQEQSTHRPYQASLPYPEVHKIRWVAGKFQHLYLPVPLLE
jgi:hypothetical protein